MLTANRPEKYARSAESVASVNRSPRKKTHTAPAVRPNIAIVMQKNANWYQVTKEKMRVSISWSIKVDAVMRKTPL